jgi:hypothetical protein
MRRAGSKDRRIAGRQGDESGEVDGHGFRQRRDRCSTTVAGGRGVGTSPPTGHGMHVGVGPKPLHPKR